MPTNEMLLDSIKRLADAELLRFVRKRGKEIEFVITLHRIIGDKAVADVGSNWAMLDATPAQQCAAFDATFKDELEKIQ